jgi:RNA polymerase sigma-70 factor (ECF subfamily)
MPEATSPTGVAAPDDETLVRLARQDSRSACEELFRRHRSVAFGVAYRLLGNEQDALDAMQDGLLRAFTGLKDFDGRSGFKTWLVRIVSNAAIDLGRKRGRRAMLWVSTGSASDLDPPNGQAHRLDQSASDDPARELHRADLRRVLNAALARLTPKVRTTFVLFAEAGLSYREIAEVQNIPIGTVMSRLNAARQKLQSDPEIESLNGI